MKAQLTLLKLIQNLALLLMFTALNFQFSSAFAQGTAFTYQGRLNDGATPANGSYDLTFRLFDAGSGGSPVGIPYLDLAQSVSNGLFTVTLDFGDQFPGTDRWLDIAVRTNGAGLYTSLMPRQALTPAPYAIFASSASNLSGTILASQLPVTVVTNNASGLSLAGSFTGNGGSVTNVNAASLNGATSSDFWQLSGNIVTAGKFLGSTNNQPLELRANNQRAIQLAYASNAVDGYSPNIIAGLAGNFVSNGVVGATIGGGGSTSLGTNRVLADFGTVVGGLHNTAQGVRSTAMGFGSTASGDTATAMGNSTTASGSAATAMGVASVASGPGSTAMGNSTASGPASTAMGKSTATNSYATAMGNSVAIGQYSTASGESEASGFASTSIGNGQATGDYSSTLGFSSAVGSYSTAMGSSTAVGNYSSAMGESGSLGSHATAMGQGNADGDYSLAAGYGAFADHNGTFVWADVTGGSFISTAVNQFLIRAAGGVGIGTAAPETPLHVAGIGGITLGTSATGGGYTALRIDLSAAMNGYAELQAISQAGSSYGNLVLQANGGNVGIGTTTPASKLTVNGNIVASGTITGSSDRNVKEHFSPVSVRDVLEKVSSLPISEWNYKADNETLRHIGPMAQDFYAAFNVGMDDKHISMVDADGVALAAIQGLNQKLDETRAENAELKQQNGLLARRLSELESMVKQIPPLK